MFSKLSSLLILFFCSTQFLSASLLEDFDNENYAAENSSARPTASDFLKEALRTVVETRDMGGQSLEMLEEQGEKLGAIEHCLDDRLSKTLKRSSILIYNLTHSVQGLLLGDVQFFEKKTLRILEYNETYAQVRLNRLSRKVWEERVLGIKENSLILYGRVFQRNYAKRIPLEEARVEKVPDYKCDDRQFCLAVAHKRNKLMFHFKTREAMVFWKKKLEQGFSEERKALRKEKREKMIASLGGKGVTSEASDEEKGPDGFTKKDHENLDFMMDELGEIYDQAIEMGSVLDSHTRQIKRVTKKVEKNIGEVESQRRELRRIR